MQHQDIKAKRNNLPTPPLRIVLFLWICPWKWQVEFYVWYILTLCLESNYLVNKKNYVFWKIRKMVNSCFTGVLSYCGFKVYNPRYCEVCFYLVNQPKSHYGSHIQTAMIQWLADCDFEICLIPFPILWEDPLYIFTTYIHVFT